MRMPALAVVGPDHQIIRSTETFRRKYETAAVTCERWPELDRVLTGKADAAVVDLGDFTMAIEAVTDAAGKRQAILSPSAEEASSDPDSPLAWLREAADASPAMVWVKDLDGRYLYVNPRFEHDLETSEERLLGRTDADLPPVETVDGPRLRYLEDGLEEPLQLEYTVPEYEWRPSMAAFRFALRDRGDDPVATCGVAARGGQLNLARDEAVRLMELERWNRLDPGDLRAELLEQWHVRSAPGGAGEADGAWPETSTSADTGIPPDSSAPVGADASAEPDITASAGATIETDATADPDAAVITGDQAASEAEVGPEDEAAASADIEARLEPDPPDAAPHQREDEWVRQLRQAAWMAARESISETADALQSELQLARKWAERVDELQGELQEAHARIRQAEAEAKQALGAAQLAGEEASRWRAELDQARLELEREKAEAHTVRSEVEAARRELGAARAQTEALRGPADAALRLSEELGRALAVERERGDELARTLGRIRARLGDFETALAREPPAVGLDR